MFTRRRSHSRIALSLVFANLMVRPLRIKYAGAVYHITSRRNERKPAFKSDQDRITLMNGVSAQLFGLSIALFLQLTAKRIKTQRKPSSRQLVLHFKIVMAYSR
jgi:hypothetical protein